MARKTYLLEDGSTVTVDDSISLLGPNPNLAGTTAQNSPRDLKHQPIQFWKADEAHRPKPDLLTGYGINQDELNEYLYHCGRNS
jgi:hypothetical protein